MASAAPLDLGPVYQAAGREWNVDPSLLQAVAGQESGGTANPDQAQSTAGARGRMQLMPGTAQEMGVTDTSDPVQNVYGGAKYLSQMLDKYGTPELALAAYNAGPGRVDDYLSGARPLPVETVNYIPGVTKRYQAIAGSQPQSVASGSPAGGSDPANDPLAQTMAALRAQPPGTAGGAGANSAPPPAASAGSANPYAAMSPADFFAATTSTTPAAAAASPGQPAPVSPNGATSAQSASGSNPANPYAAMSPGQFFSATAGAPPVAAPAAGPQAGTGVMGTLENFAEGAGHGVQQISRALYSGLDAANKAVPSLNGLNQVSGIDPQAALANLDSQDKTYQQSGVGNTLAGMGGELVGQTVTTLPVMGAAGRAVAYGGNALAGAAPETANLLASAAGANALTRGAAYAGKNALMGAGYGSAQGIMTGGDSVRDAETGALLGGVGAPAAKLLVGAGKMIGSGVGSVVNKLTGSTAALDRDIDAAIARSRGLDSNALNPGAVSTAAEPALVTAPAPPASVGSSPASGPVAASGEAIAPVPAAAPAASPIPLVPPVPASAGAAATSEADLAANAMTPAQAAASRATGFADRLSQQAPLRFDNTEYVPGSTPTLAEQLADPELAAQQRVIAPGNPDFANLDRANNEARLAHFDQIAGSPTTLETLQAARSAQADTDLSAAWANKKDVDAQPVLDQINAALQGPSGKLTPVQSALDDAKAALQKSDGTGLETDPEMLYGARKQISYLMSKTGQRANPSYAEPTVVRQLQGVKDALDSVIEPGAPGYQQYLDNYAAASKPIDVQDLLQSKRAGLLGVDGTMQLSRVHSMMKSIGDQMSLPGPNAAKSLSDDDVEKLFNLRQDLLRQNNRSLQRAAGSDTQHNQTVAGEMGMNALTAGAHVLAAHVPGGNLLVGPAFASAIKSSNAKIRNQLTNRLLTPEPMESLNVNPGTSTNALAGSWQTSRPSP